MTHATSNRLIWMLTILGAALLLVWRFALGTPEAAVWIQDHWDYRIYGLMTLLTLYAGWRTAAEAGAISACRSRPATLAALLAWIAALLFFWTRHEPMMLKVNFDEPQHAATAYMMHTLGKVGSPIGAVGHGEAMQIIRDAPTFRSAYYPYLVSLCHDYLGFSPNHPYLVNFAACGALLAIVYAIARTLGHSRPRAWTAVVLISSVPLVAQVATSGAYDLLNLTLLAGYILALIRLHNAPTTAAFGLAASLGVLLALVRSESIVYLVLLGGTVLWLKKTRRLPNAPWYLPLLLPGLLSALDTQIYLTSDTRFLTQGANAPGVATFSFQHWLNHSETALAYFFTLGSATTSAGWLAWAGVTCALFLGAGILTNRIRPGYADLLFAALTLICLGFYSLTLCSFWGGPDVPEMARFTLPFWLLAILAVLLLTARIPIARFDKRVLVGALVIFHVYSAASIINHSDTRRMKLAALERCSLEIARRHGEPDVIFIGSTSSTLIAHRHAAYPMGYYRMQASRFAAAKAFGLFSKIYLVIPRRTDGLVADDGFAVNPSFVSAQWRLRPIDRIVLQDDSACEMLCYEVLAVQNTAGVWVENNLKAPRIERPGSQEEYRARIRAMHP